MTVAGDGSQIFHFPIGNWRHRYNSAALPRSLWWEELVDKVGHREQLIIWLRLQMFYDPGIPWNQTPDVCLK